MTSASTSPMEQAEAILPFISYFKNLRPDELYLVSRQWTVSTLEPTQSLSFATPTMILVVSGTVRLRLSSGDELPLFAGDTYGESEVMSGTSSGATNISATTSSIVAYLTRPELDAIFKLCPVVAVGLLSELARDLKWHNDALREVRLAEGQRLSPTEISRLAKNRLTRLHHYRRGPLRYLNRLLWHTLFVKPAEQPVFWIFIGALSALASARSVVAYILDHGLQKQLFALIQSGNGHPIHVHHFNYGLLLVSSAGLLSMLPRARRWLKTLSFVFGFGLGLMVDEFALFWNLNPDYYQASSEVAAGLVLFVLVQVVYFRRLYIGLGRRLAARLQT